MSDFCARAILSDLHSYAKVRNFDKLAVALRRTMQPWGIAVAEFNDPLTVEDEDTLECFWRSMFAAADLKEPQLKFCALQFYGACVGAAAQPRFLALQQSMASQSTRISDTAMNLLRRRGRPAIEPGRPVSITGTGVMLRVISSSQ